MRYKEGDKLLFKIKETDQIPPILKIGDVIFGLELLEHTQAPFDWSTVRPGMAFRLGIHILHYIGPDLDNDDYVILKGNVSFGSIAMEGLTRAPEHDIEVPE